MTSDDLELAYALERMAGHVRPPAPTFDLAGAVRARIEADRAEAAGPLAARRRRSRVARAVAAAAAAVAVITAGIAGAAELARAPRPRSSVAVGRHLLRLPVTPSAPISRHTTLTDVRDELGFRVMVPAALGDPDTVIDQSRPGLSRVVLIYRSEGEASPVQVVETSGGNEYDDIADATLVRHDGFTGFWFQAAPHAGVVSADANGWLNGHPARQWNSLLWQGPGVTIRLDSNLPLPDAIALASSMTPADLEHTIRNLS